MVRKVLVIDDSPVIRYKYQLLLANRGCRVVNAGNGREGLRQLEAHSDIDLILVGIHMPVMEGLDFLKLVRQDQRYDRVAVFLLASKGQEEAVLRAFTLGAQGFIRKQDNAGTLERLIERVKGLGAEGRVRGIWTSCPA